ncbi:hypothetical protein GGP41_002358 [Bipolaris sorokiniana]|uniref:Uncharacterized protein n=1 Tax=Cochliobolus sativus TaxID=45130 RepID=A0A8H5ZL42_COCSA|nr:hypothetical protein GGP41_002358 [Bipolaris sorokiniana]
MPIRHPSSDCCLASSRLALSMYIPHLDKITEIGSLQRSMTMHVLLIRVIWRYQCHTGHDFVNLFALTSWTLESIPNRNRFSLVCLVSVY